jgi:hypothetical protein
MRTIHGRKEMFFYSWDFDNVLKTSIIIKQINSSYPPQTVSNLKLISARWSCTYISLIRCVFVVLSEPRVYWLLVYHQFYVFLPVPFTQIIFRAVSVLFRHSGAKTFLFQALIKNENLYNIITNVLVFVSQL